MPSGAYTGKVTVTTSSGTSNGLPFIVTSGSYSASCPAQPDDSAFQIVTASLQDGAVNKAYSVALSATGGTQPYTWSLAGNPLPSGLSLSPSGVISGTPTTAAGPVSLTIKSVDSNDLVTEALLNLTIDSTPQSSGTIYSYSGNYDHVGNVTGYNDSVMGAWTFQYDTLNRLATANATSGDFDGQYACWNFDSFGNRLQQELSSAAFQSGSGGPNPCQPQPTANLTAFLNEFTINGTDPATNRIAASNARGVTAIPGFDASGNMTSDGVNNYFYDAEDRICAVASTPIVGNTTYTGYLYDADGNRVAKGSLSNCSLTSCSCDPSANGFTLTESYILGPSGEELTIHDGNNNWQRTNVFGAGRLLATYDANGLHLHLTDPLGTRRVQVSSTGYAETDCQSLPYGDQLNCFADPNSPTTADDSTPIHFTGKERDTESGNDYFGARYYASSMGRFLSPDSIANDWELRNPQTWNRYMYARNNPLIFVDPDGAAVELLGDDKQRQKELAELQKDVGNKDAASRLYINEVKDGDNTRYFVGIKGDVGDFMRLGDTAHDLANLIGDKAVVEFGLTNRDLSYYGGAATYDKGEDGGKNQNIRVLVNPHQIDIGDDTLRNTFSGLIRFGGQEANPPWKVGVLTTGIATWHEFGHAWAGMHGRGVGLRSFPESRSWENRMRKQVYGPLGPNNAPRVKE